MASCKCGATDDRPGAPPCECECGRRSPAAEAREEALKGDYARVRAEREHYVGEVIQLRAELEKREAEVARLASEYGDYRNAAEGSIGAAMRRIKELESQPRSAAEQDTRRMDWLDSAGLVERHAVMQTANLRRISYRMAIDAALTRTPDPKPEGGPSNG